MLAGRVILVICGICTLIALVVVTTTVVRKFITWCARSARIEMSVRTTTLGALVGIGAFLIALYIAVLGTTLIILAVTYPAINPLVARIVGAMFYLLFAIAALFGCGVGLKMALAAKVPPTEGEDSFLASALNEGVIETLIKRLFGLLPIRLALLIVGVIAGTLGIAWLRSAIQVATGTTLTAPVSEPDQDLFSLVDLNELLGAIVLLVWIAAGITAGLFQKDKSEVRFWVSIFIMSVVAYSIFGLLGLLDGPQRIIIELLNRLG